LKDNDLHTIVLCGTVLMPAGYRTVHKCDRIPA